MTAWSIVSRQLFRPDEALCVSQIKLRILGESVIQVGETVVEPTATHIFALLLYLAVERGKLVSRSQLASMLFPERSAANAGHNLRQLLYRLRKIAVPLEATAAAVRLPAESVVEAPESVLTRSAGEGPRNESTGFALLPNYTPPTEALSRWLEAYRDAISSKLLRYLARDLARARDGADWSAVERCAKALLQLDPLNETATLGLAEAMARSGSKHKAVRLLRDFAEDVGHSDTSLALPSRLLTRRIVEEVQPPSANASCTPLVGRESELRLLTDAWTRARRGRCTTIVITGEPSIGKTRILEEVSALVRMDGSGVVLYSRAQHTYATRPMSLFSDLCLALLSLPGAAGCNPDSLPHLRRLRGDAPKTPDAGRAEIDVFFPEGATRAAVIDLLDSVASEKPILICVDDADYLDSSSRELLASLPEFAGSLPLLVIAAGTRLSQLPHKRDRTIRLGPLSQTDAQRLAILTCERLSYAPPATALEWCIDAAAGNPSHLELLLRHTASLKDTAIAPPDLIALIASRLESLPPASKHALQACVVFGMDCNAATVSALTGLDGYELLLSLEALVEGCFVTDSPSGISCRSSLIAESIRTSTTPVVRALLHRRAAEFLERAHAKHTSQAVIWQIADHWQAAGNKSKALQWRRMCWHHLLSIGQPIAAAASIRRHLQQSSSDLESAELLDDLILALHHSSDVCGQLSALKERTGLSDRVGDTAATRLRLAADIADARYHNYDDTVSGLQELQALVASTELDEMRRLRTAKLLMITADGLFDATLARSVYSAMPRQLQPLSAELLRDQVELIYQTTFGDRDVALCIADKLEALVHRLELSPTTISVQLTATLARHLVDRLPPSTGQLECLFERCLAASMYDAAVRTSVRIATICFDAGAHDASMYWCQRTIQVVERGAIQRLGGDFLSLQIDLALEHGDLTTAQRLLDVAPQHYPVHSSPRHKREYLVYRVAVEQSCSDRLVATSDIEQLLNWHRRIKHLGRHDDHMQVLWTALWRSGRQPEASDLLREYLLVSRRERRACSPSFRSRTAADPIWGELQEGSPTIYDCDGCDRSPSRLSSSAPRLEPEFPFTSPSRAIPSELRG